MGMHSQVWRSAAMVSLLSLTLWVAIPLHSPALTLAGHDIDDPAFVDECVRTHNAIRSAVNPPASNMLYMTWDEALAKSARAWARACMFSHNPLLESPARVHPHFSPVGENVWVGSPHSFSPRKTIERWHSEVDHYTYASRTCARMCGHYTQVVWAESYKVGCAAQTCTGVDGFSTSGNATVFVCNYGNAGNRKGTHPYKQGPACSTCLDDPKQCHNGLCRSATRDTSKSYRWTPDWEIRKAPSSSSSCCGSPLIPGSPTILIIFLLL